MATQPVFFHYLTSFGSSGHAPGLFSNPKAMAFSPDGQRLAVCDTDNHRVVVLRVTFPDVAKAADLPAEPPKPVEPAKPPPRPAKSPVNPDEFFSPDLDEIFGPPGTGSAAGSGTAGEASGEASGEAAEEPPLWSEPGSPDPGEAPAPDATPGAATGDGPDSDGDGTPAEASDPGGAGLAAADGAKDRPDPLAHPFFHEPGEAAHPAEGPLPGRVGVPSFTVEIVLGGIWPYEGSLEPADWPDRYREPDHADGIKPPRSYSGRPYHGGQARIRPWDRVPIDRFHYPQGVAWLDNRTLLVSDTENHRLKGVRLDGETLFILGQEGWKDGYFHQPLGVAVDCEKNIYVVEPRSKFIRGLGLDAAQRPRVQGNRLQVFGPDKRFARRLGHMHHMSGRDYRQFKDLSRVCVTKDLIYVADNGNRRVLVFDKELKWKEELTEWPFYRLRYPNGIHNSLDGRLAITDTGHHTVLILAPDRHILQIVGGFGTQKGRFSNPWEAHFGPHGDLYVLDTRNCRIQVFRGPYSKEYERCPKPPAPPPPPPEPPPSPPPPLPSLPPPASPTFSF
ncbi:MAG: hypothetical protein GX442_00525 [Candidatus Riflebacteria bacterium]|nr:hypothetical protein [Candidatus Riflebacteria bacterium]